ncbi:hypothetical protein MA9V1_193 [Chryseobacterium phage MA9V-1]|nr:hypothetical protein MA9V1_193 [Chryseobacterium phage MA9V-1]
MSILQDYSVVIGSILVIVATFLKKGNVQQLNQYINTINMLRVDLLALKKDNADIASDIRKLQAELHDKDRLVALLEATSWDLPFPYWLKDMQHNMVYINAKYEKTFNVRSIDYVGKKDSDIWPVEIAEKFKANDQKMIDGDDEFIISQTEVDGFVVIKWKRWAGSILIGVAGMCIPINVFHNFTQDVLNVVNQNNSNERTRN